MFFSYRGKEFGQQIVTFFQVSSDEIETVKELGAEWWETGIHHNWRFGGMINKIRYVLIQIRATFQNQSVSKLPKWQSLEDHSIWRPLWAM